MTYKQSHFIASDALWTQGKADASLTAAEARMATALGDAGMSLPLRRSDIDVTGLLAPAGGPGTQRCFPNAPLQYQVTTMPKRGASAEERKVHQPRFLVAHSTKCL